MSQWLGGQERLQIIDFGAANQQNLDYVTGLGHRLYFDDLLRSFEHFFPDTERTPEHLTASRIEEFLASCLDFPDQSVDGALIWDRLQFLPASLGSAVLERLHRVLAPDALLLALFHTDSSAVTAAPQNCRILNQKHVQLTSAASRLPIVQFNTRAIERYFQRFQTLKFFLTRDNLQEVLVRR
ncbi:MAG: hypothetical protein HY821_02305 [Acidobacteria bacterium]|nr:hypothetical protein [Acidobacteriota bacterium]